MLSHCTICLTLEKTANAFGIYWATSIIIRRVTQAIALHMAPNYITLPQTDEGMKEKLKTFFITRGTWCTLCVLCGAATISILFHYEI